VFKNGVETIPERADVDTYPAVPRPVTVDCRVVFKKDVDTYPAVPRPVTVDCRVVFKKDVDT